MQAYAPNRQTTTTADGAANELFVGGLPKKASNDTLLSYFSKFGSVRECRIVLDKVTQISRGFAFVTFNDVASVKKVLAVPQHKYLKTVVSVKPSVSKETSAQNNMEEKERKVFVVGLKLFATRTDDLINHFSQFGEVEDVQLKANKGFGFVLFRDRTSVLAALHSDEPHIILGKEVEVRPVLMRNELNNLKAARQPEMSSQASNMTLLQQLEMTPTGHGSVKSLNSAEILAETRPRSSLQVAELLGMHRLQPDWSRPEQPQATQDPPPRTTTNPIYESNFMEIPPQIIVTQNPADPAKATKSVSGRVESAYSRITADVAKQLSHLYDDDEEEDYESAFARSVKGHPKSDGQYDKTSTQASAFIDGSSLLLPQHKRHVEGGKYDSMLLGRLGQNENGEYNKVKSDFLGAPPKFGEFAKPPVNDPSKPQKKYESFLGASFTDQNE